MKVKKKIITIVLVLIVLMSNNIYAIPKPTNISVNIPKEKVHLPNKEWVDKIEYIVGKDDIPFKFDSTYEYDNGETKGTLNATKVIITPSEKIENKTYIDEYKTFTKYSNATFKDRNDYNFNNTYPINEDGYVGLIPRIGVQWSENWERGRRKWIEQTRESGWTQGSPDSSINYNYYDSESGTNINTNLNFIRVVDTKEKIGYEYSESSGNRFNYSQRNDNLGYMSQNSRDYWSGAYLFNNSPKPPRDYYGSRPDKENWELVECRWDEDRAYSADELSYISDIKANLAYRNGSWWWKSESGKLNKYRKGVYLKYRKPHTYKNYTSLYGATVNLPDYIRDFTGNAMYQGTLSKKVEKINYTCNYWNVNIIYEGDTQLKDVIVGGSISPNPSKQGGKVSFNISTKYYPNKIDIFIPGELQGYFNKSVISLNISEQLYLNTTYDEILALYIPETIDKDGKRLKDPYKFKVVATRADGSKGECILSLDINGSILDKLKTVTLY